MSSYNLGVDDYSKRNSTKILKKMLLGKLIKNIKPAYKSIKFNNIRFNSRDCKTNDIFFLFREIN